MLLEASVYAFTFERESSSELAQVHAVQTPSGHPFEHRGAVAAHLTCSRGSECLEHRCARK
eukprot:14693237-Alexandrium_andersonii.AAC.1